jgi:hypothetical protein
LVLSVFTTGAGLTPTSIYFLLSNFHTSHFTLFLEVVYGSMIALDLYLF